MNKWLSCVAALFLFGCASERVVLLPSPEGGKSAVVLRDANGEQELSQPYAASVRRLGLSHPYQASAEEVQARYGATLEAMPPRPVSHVLYFVSGADQLTEASMVELDTVRRLLAERPAAELVVIGHTDTVGIRVTCHHDVSVNLLGQRNGHGKGFGIFGIRRNHRREIAVLHHLFGHAVDILKSPLLQ